MKNKSLSILRNYLELSKISIMIPVSLTGFTGFFIYDPHFSYRLLLVTLSILLLSISASVLNQIQEADIDSKMNRTHDRPIPAGKINMKNAILFFFINIVSGTALLYFAGNLTSLIIGIITIFWYNVIYTYSKRITAFAVVPGAVTGALPALIGWVAAGGGLWDKPVVFLEFLFFTGQIPHFWLMIVRYGEEYKNAGIPSLTEIFSATQINRLTFTWVLTSVIAALYLCSFEIIQNSYIDLILVIASAIIVWQFFDLIKIRQKAIPGTRKYSMMLYFYFLLIIILLITDRIIK